MKRWGPLLPVARADTPLLVRIYLLGGAVLLAVAFLVYFHRLSFRVERQTEAMGGLVAHVIAFTTLGMEESPGAQTSFQNVTRALSFPVVLTDVEGRPLAWNRQVKKEVLSVDRLLTEDLEHPSPPLAGVLESMRRLDRSHAPIPMLSPDTGDTLALLHYGSPGLVHELRWIPWVTIGAAALFGVVGLLLIRGLKRAEQSFIWAGMAKETAHQMGTPLSSLLGWIEVLRHEVVFQDDRALLSRELFEEVVAEVAEDTDRLERVAARFSQIGSVPRLELGSVLPVVGATVDYFRRRFPRGLELTLEAPGELPPVRLNRVLLGWVLENLIKNAQNAVPAQGGRISVRVERAENAILVRVRDNGHGVKPGYEKRIFRPGVSTRRRGWGLGLPLAQRIVESYHGGRLELTWTAPGQGAEFTVFLPVAAAPAASSPTSG